MCSHCSVDAKRTVRNNRVYAKIKEKNEVKKTQNTLTIQTTHTQSIPIDSYDVHVIISVTMCHMRMV